MIQDRPKRRKPLTLEQAAALAVEQMITPDTFQAFVENRAQILDAVTDHLLMSCEAAAGRVH